MSTRMQQARGEIEAVERRIAELLAEREDLLESLDKISIDLDNNLQAFVATTGRPAQEYFPWRHRARWAAHHKRLALRKTENAIRASKQEHTRLQMLLLSYESDYRGEDPSELLRATYHLLMYVVGLTRPPLDEAQVGLIATVQLQCGYGVPAGDDHASN